MIRYPETYQSLNQSLDALDYPFLSEENIHQTGEYRMMQTNPLAAAHSNPMAVGRTWQGMEEKIESQQELINTLMANCKLMERVVASSRAQEATHHPSLSPPPPSASINYGTVASPSRSSVAIASSSVGPADLSTPSLMRMFDDVLLCLDQIELTVDRELLDDTGRPAPDPPYTQSSARAGLAAGTTLRLLRAELRLKARRSARGTAFVSAPGSLLHTLALAGWPGRFGLPFR